MEVTLTDDQSNKWIELVRAHESLRKWSDVSKTEEEIHLIAIQLLCSRSYLTADIGESQDMVSYYYGNFISLDKEGKGSFGWKEFMAFQDMIAKTHRTKFGGYWVAEQKTQKDLFDFIVTIFGTDGRITID